MYKDPWIKAISFHITYEIEKQRESKILIKTWSKNIKNNQRTVEGNAQIGAGLCFHKNQNWKERKKETILLKSPNFDKVCWELTDLSKNLELFKMHQFNYSACSYTFI